MADSVIPRQQGDDYQAMYFWYQACNLFYRDTTAVRVSWELNDIPGFDDVSIHYEPAYFDSSGSEVYNRFFQVKFHANQKQGFNCDALMDCTFIGNTTESLLQRLHKNYKKDKVTFLKSRYHIVNIWSLDYSDPLKDLLDNNGAIIISRLFDGTGENSKMGKIRKKWCDHLILSSEDDLKEILLPLRIEAGAKGIDASRDDLNIRFTAVGFKTISDTMRTSPYASLIKRLHAENRKTFTKDELLEILRREQLIYDQNGKQNNNLRIGVRSFKKGTNTMKYDTDEYLCLLSHFSGRFPVSYELWNGSILPSISEFSEKVLSYNKPLEVHLDTHLSLAFAMGYFLDTKAGVPIKIWQKGPTGKRLLYSDVESNNFLSRKNESNWDFVQVPVFNNQADVVLAINVTHSIIGQVQEHVKNNLPKTSKIISATIAGGPGHQSIRDGNHALLAVLDLLRYLNSNLTPEEEKGNVHLFIAAPNTLAFTMGQYLKSLGRIKLYEFDFENKGPYIQTIEFPINNKKI